MKRKSLGLKTILVISIVSCLLTIVSIQSAYIFPASEFAEIRMDPLRLAAQIVSGVGFLGAGVILRRQDDTVSGLTTAAIVWGAAGIGIATGAGFYIEAVAGVTLLLFSVELVPLIIRKMGFQKLHIKERHLKIVLDNKEFIESAIQDIETHVLNIDNVHIKDLSDGSFLVALLIIIEESQTTPDLYQKIAAINTIKQIEIKA